MARVAQGQVGDRPFGRTVYAIAARGFSGELRLTQDGQTYKVGWREGRIVAADSPAPSDTIGRIALGAGLVTTAQLSDALRAVARGGGGTQLEIPLRRVVRGYLHAHVRRRDRRDVQAQKRGDPGPQQEQGAGSFGARNPGPQLVTHPATPAQRAQLA